MFPVLVKIGVALLAREVATNPKARAAAAHTVRSVAEMLSSELEDQEDARPNRQRNGSRRDKPRRERGETRTRTVPSMMERKNGTTYRDVDSARERDRLTDLANERGWWKG